MPPFRTTVSRSRRGTWKLIDIAGDPEPVALDMLRTVADDSHIVYGSDFPHSPAKVIIGKKRHFDANRKYDELRDKIYRKNALALLNPGTEE